MEQLEEKVIRAFSSALRDIGKQPGETYGDMLKDFLPSMKDFKHDVKAGVKTAVKSITNPVKAAKDASEKRARATTNENIQENFFSATDFGSHAAKQGLKLHPGEGGDILAVHPTTKQVHGKWAKSGFGYMLHEPRDAYNRDNSQGIHTSKMYDHPVYESKEQVDEVAGYSMPAHQKTAVQKFFDKEPHSTKTFSTDGKTLESNGMTGTLARHEPDGSVTVTGAYGNVSQTWKNHIEKEAKKRGIKTQSEHNLRPHAVDEAQRLTPLGRKLLGAAALGTAIAATPYDKSPQPTVTTDKGESKTVLTTKPTHKAKGIVKSKDGKTYFEYEGGSVYPATK